MLKSQQLELKNDEISYKSDKLKADKEKFEQMCINLESQKNKLLEQNSWLETEIEKFKQQTISNDNDYSKIDSLEKDISTFKQNADDVIKQKDMKINQLEHELIQTQKAKELLNFEMIKQQKSNEIQIQNLELKFKKEAASLTSSKLTEKAVKKVKSSTVEQSKKSNKKKKDVKYHSDTEEISDFPSKKLGKELTKKPKISELKHKISILEIELENKKNQIDLVSTHNQKLQSDLNNSIIDCDNIKLNYETKLNEVNEEAKDIHIKYQRLKLDKLEHNENESEQLVQIKDEHAKLMVENNWLIRELEDLKKNGFTGTSSVMRMVDDIELTKKQLEEEFSYEIDQLKSQLSQ